MTLSAGTTLGRYEIRSLIGAGGMGEVYLALDPKIGREVAIKVLPIAVSGDSDRLARFEQEAQAAGSLNHPNILAIYDVQTDNGAPYVVSELLEGETLRDKMAVGPVPQRKALDYALQIAHGLAAAHEKGIVHRDLKPENVFVTSDGRVKILDFGLAKLMEPEADAVATDLPTRKLKTDPGTIMGTIAYMSPEQVRARTVDHRTDIFSLGVVFYEMLTGKRAFDGDSTADLMSAILREEPPRISNTNATLSPALERVIEHCLEKNPAERFHSARDLAFAIQALSGTTSLSDQAMVSELPGPRRSFRELIGWGLAGLLLIAAGTFAALYFSRPETDKPTTRFVVSMPEKATDISNPQISPDGRTLAFLATTDGKRFLYVRQMDSLAAQRLNGTDDAVAPFWSPDSRFIGFFSEGKLRKIEAGGGPPQTLCDAQLPTGGTWNHDGVILFGSLTRKSIHRVSAAGGESSAVTTLDEGRSETEHWHPWFLPDGKHFLYYAWNGSEAETSIYVTSIDNADRKIVLKANSNVEYVAPGFILFARGSTLLAQQFDLSKLDPVGEPFPILENVVYTSNTGYSHFSVSENGVLAYWSGTTTGRQLGWFDRAGKKIAAVGPPAEYNDVVLSPDEKKAVLQRLTSGDTSGSDLWLMDLARGVPSRFTFDSTGEDDPAWSADGSTVIFTVIGDGKSGIYRKNSTGVGSEELLGKFDGIGGDGLDWSRDSKSVLFPATGTGTGLDLWLLPLAPSGAQQAYPWLNSPFNEFQGRFSPDGRWVAYVSNESGRPEVYVRSFPDGGGQWQVSTTGGAQPIWRRDGKELFYIGADRRLMAVEIRSAAGFETATPVELFQTQVAGYTLPNRYAASADGQRFLINTQVEETSQTPITVVLNWAATIKK